jgi:hypothetical protein
MVYNILLTLDSNDVSSSIDQLRMEANKAGNICEEDIIKKI